jgi:hypothetical protein
MCIVKKLNKFITGLAIAATLIAGTSSFVFNSKESASDNIPVTTQSIVSDPGGEGGH